MQFDLGNERLVSEALNGRNRWLPYEPYPGWASEFAGASALVRSGVQLPEGIKTEEKLELGKQLLEAIDEKFKQSRGVE